MYTYQDLQGIGEGDEARMEFVRSVIADHKASELYREAVIAGEYDRHRNRTIMDYQKLLYTVSGQAVPDNFSANFKMGRAFFPFFVTQEVQFLLGNGVSWSGGDEMEDLDGDGKADTSDRLGTMEKPFDAQLQDAAHKALVGGVAYGFYNNDHVDVFGVDEYAPLHDEETGALRGGVRFWQLNEAKPLRATLYEEDGYTDYIWGRRSNGEIEGEVLNAKRPYKQIVSITQADGTEIIGGENYPGFPIVPLYARREYAKRPELTQSEITGLREQIDCYDLIKSGFANTVDEASIMYWAIQGAGGMDDTDLARFVERMKTVHAAVVEDNGKAEAHSIDAPYASREALLQRLEKDIFKDAMALDVEYLASGAVTATQIRAAYEPLNEKTDGFEYCVTSFVLGILSLAGIDDNPTFTRSTIVNVQEEVQTVLSAASVLDESYVTEKILTILGDGDRAEEILEQMDADELERGGAVDENGEPVEDVDTEDIMEEAEEAAGQPLNGIQTQSLISIIGEYSQGNLSEGQAANLIATAVGITKQKALDILQGN